MSIFEIFQGIGENVWLYGGAFVLVLSILVFVHEWGHYIVARMFGVKVETFSIGFGKELGGFTDKNDTRWKFALIPLGGYVKLFGDIDPDGVVYKDDVKEEDKIPPMSEAERQQAFFAKPVWQRALVVVAGPAINYIFAILILTGLFAFQGQPVTPPTAAAVIQDSSASKSGFQPHDFVLSIDGNSVTSFEDIRREMMIALDTEKKFIVRRDGEEIEVFATPEKVTQEDRFGFQHSRGLLGLISPRNAIQVSTIKKVDGRAYGDEAATRKALLAKMGKPFEITVPSSGDEGEQVLSVKPFKDNNEFLNTAGHEDEGILFIGDVRGKVFVKYPIHVAAAQAVEESWVITRGTLEALGQMVVGTRSAQELGGIIRIGALAGDMAKQGLVALILFTALLSINLGLINLFPIPMLDGGHLVFYAVEALLGRPVPERVQEYAFRTGLVFLVALMVFANLNDIIQLFI